MIWKKRKKEESTMTPPNGNIFRISGHLCREFAGHRWIPGLFPAQRPVTLMFSLNNWVNTREAGDLRRHRAHYDVTVMERKKEVTRQPFLVYKLVLEFSLFCSWLVLTVCSPFLCILLLMPATWISLSTLCLLYVLHGGSSLCRLLYILWEPSVK